MNITPFLNYCRTMALPQMLWTRTLQTSITVVRDANHKQEDSFCHRALHPHWENPETEMVGQHGGDSTDRYRLTFVLLTFRCVFAHTVVLRESLTERELDYLNLPVSSVLRCATEDRLSMTTDDLLSIPHDGSLPVTRTSAFIQGCLFVCFYCIV